MANKRPEVSVSGQWEACNRKTQVLVLKGDDLRWKDLQKPNKDQGEIRNMCIV